jgi:general secretion pathway protein F
MPIFRYSGFKSDGVNVSGAVEASGLSDAAAKIREEGIFPGEITEPLIRRRKRMFRRTDETFLPNMTRQLSILLSSGVPLIDALQSLSAENRGFYRDMLITIKEHVSGGAGLSRAMEDFGDYFPEFYIHMVQAGEQSGALEKTLIRLADFLESQNAIRSKVRSSMIYPIFMIGVSIVVLSFLFTFVVPKIVKIFKDAESSLPFITHVLIFISNIFIHYWWVFIGVIAVFFLPVRKLLNKHRLLIDRIMLRLPGNIIQNLYYSRFARTLGFLIEGRLPMLKALDLSAKSMGNKALEKSVLIARERVAEGQRLSASLERFSPVLIQLIATGEKSGKLAETLHRAAESYEDEFNRRINNAVSFFEPVMILLMGIVVAFIVLAVLLPIFQLNQLIR